MNLKITIGAADLNNLLEALNDAAVETAETIYHADSPHSIMEYGIDDTIINSETFENMPEKIRNLMKPLIANHIKALMVGAFEEWLAKE